MLKFFIVLILAGLTVSYDFEDEYFKEKFEIQDLTIDDIFTPAYADYLKGVLPSVLEFGSRGFKYLAHAASEAQSLDELIELVQKDAALLENHLYYL